MVSESTSQRPPSGVFTCVIRHWDLVVLLTKREIVGRYRGSILGLVWSLATPLIMLAAYTFVFSTIFQTRWETDGENNADFILLLFAGLIVYSLFVECLNRAPSLILSRANYVKKVVFPLEVLPWVSLGVALFQMSMSLTGLLLFYGLSHRSLNWTVIVFPLLIAPLGLIALGISWFLASVGVFVRDVGHAMGFVSSLLLFLAPVFYPASALSAEYRPFLYLNPLTFIIEQSRDVLIMGKLPGWYELGIYTLCSVVIAWVGFMWFERTRKGFADVL